MNPDENDIDEMALALGAIIPPAGGNVASSVQSPPPSGAANALNLPLPPLPEMSAPSTPDTALADGGNPFITFAPIAIPEQTFKPDPIPPPVAASASTSTVPISDGDIDIDDLYMPPAPNMPVGMNGADSELGAPLFPDEDNPRVSAADVVIAPPDSTPIAEGVVSAPADVLPAVAESVPFNPMSMMERLKALEDAVNNAPPVPEDPTVIPVITEPPPGSVVESISTTPVEVDSNNAAAIAALSAKFAKIAEGFGQKSDPIDKPKKKAKPIARRTAKKRTLSG